MKEIVSQPTNGVICEDGKIAKNGLRVICPFCGEIGLSQGRGGSVNVWTVGAIERRECTKCRKQFHFPGRPGRNRRSILRGGVA